MSVEESKGAEMKGEESLAKNNDVTAEPKVEEPQMVQVAESLKEETAAPPEEVLARTDDQVGDAKVGTSISATEVNVQPKEEAKEITDGQKKEGEDSPSAKAADDQLEGLNAPLKKDETERTGGQNEVVDKDSHSKKEGGEEAPQKQGARVRMKSSDLTDTRQIETDVDTHSVRTFDTISMSSKISGFSADTRSLGLDDSRTGKRKKLDMDHEILSVDIEDVERGDSDSDTSSSSTYDSDLHQNSILMKADFLLNMEMSLPDITDIRGSSTEEDEKAGSKLEGATISKISTDHGKFVNPLTGEDISSTESTETDSHKTSQMESEALDATQDDISIDIELDIQSIGSDKEIKVITQEEEYETAFVELNQNLLKAADHQEDDSDMNLEMRNQLLVNESTLNFLIGLIDRTVLEAETIDENAILEASLDKEFVLDELYAHVLEYDNERRNQQFLSAKIVEHYRRIKNFRPIVQDPLSSRQKLLTNFRKSLEEYDFLLEQKRYVTQMHNEAMNADTELLIDTEDLLTDTQKKLEQLINNTFIRSNSSTKWKSKIETFLKKVDVKLKEISATRLILIRKQHIKAEAIEKMDKVENITPSFTMSAYERTIANVMKLGSLLHDYNVSVGKVSKETCTYWNLISHMGEHRSMLQIKINNQTSNYVNMCEKHKHMRDYICKLKVKHVALQHELSEISFNVGLLDKPLLMHDYDNTKDAIDVLTVVVEDLRKQYERVQKASELRADMMRGKSLKKSENKSTRNSDDDDATVRKFTRISESLSAQSSESVSVKKSTRFSENVIRKSIQSTEIVKKPFKSNLK